MKKDCLCHWKSFLKAFLIYVLVLDDIWLIMFGVIQPDEPDNRINLKQNLDHLRIILQNLFEILYQQRKNNKWTKVNS